MVAVEEGLESCVCLVVLTELGEQTSELDASDLAAVAEPLDELCGQLWPLAEDGTSALVDVGRQTWIAELLRTPERSLEQRVGLVIATLERGGAAVVDRAQDDRGGSARALCCSRVLGERGTVPGRDAGRRSFDAARSNAGDVRTVRLTGLLAALRSAHQVWHVP
jgi:hypothetical protein